MRCYALILGAVVAATTSISAGAQSKYDKVKILEIETSRCKRMFLNYEPWIKGLALLRISLDSMCSCMAPQIVGAMTDSDIAYLIEHKGMWSPHIMGIVDSIRMDCAHALAQ